MVEVTMSTCSGVEEDTYIDKNVPDTNYEGSSLQVSSTATGAASSDTERALIKVRMPSEPDGASGIKKVELRFAVRGIANFGSTLTQGISVYKLQSTFDEDEATWRHRRTGMGWSHPGADGCFDTDGIDGVYLDLSYGTFYADITDMGLSWGDVGWLILKHPEETDNPAGKIMYLIADSTYATVGYRPALRITYIDDPPAPIKDLRIVPDDRYGD